MWGKGATELMSVNFLSGDVGGGKLLASCLRIFATEITCQHKHGGQFFDHSLIASLKFD